MLQIYTYSISVNLIIGLSHMIYIHDDEYVMKYKIKKKDFMLTYLMAINIKLSMLYYPFNFWIMISFYLIAYEFVPREKVEILNCDERGT